MNGQILCNENDWNRRKYVTVLISSVMSFHKIVSPRFAPLIEMYVSRDILSWSNAYLNHFDAIKLVSIGQVLYVQRMKRSEF